MEYSTVPPIDEFDRTAMVHDRAYARGRNLKDADYAFYKANIGKGFKRSLAALAVGGQGVLRQVGVLSDSSEKINKWPNLVVENLIELLQEVVLGLQ